VISGVLLDFYGTVVEDDDDVMADIARLVAARAPVAVTGDQVLAAWHREYEAVAAGPVFRLLRDCAAASLSAVMTELGCPGAAAELCAPQFAVWRSPPLRPGTMDFLDQVGVPVCIVSDVDRADLEAATAHHGLTFTATVTSEDVGAYKPDRAMFARGLAALGLASHEVVHVGNSLDADVRGAQAAGIRAVWVDPRGHIEDLSGLIAFLGADAD
jgi:2-haloacid dehalogenase/putative hydrolase of the HAD superfamily